MTPPIVSGAFEPGDSVPVDKTVDVPEVPPTLDFCLLVDLSGSYSDDLPNIRALDDGIVDGVRAVVPDSLFCLGSFVDFPFSPWGSAGAGDFAYRLDQDLTASKSAFTGAVDGLTTRFGGDEPESQYEALFQMATGAGRDVPPPGPSLGDIPLGQNPSFRANATKVIAITTDASFHQTGDPGDVFPYPGADRDTTVAALNAQGIKVIAIKAPGSGAEMDDLAASTGGSVQTTGSTSAEIASAILAGLSSLPQDISAQAVGCDPLQISFDPPVIPGVVGPAVVNFLETINVPPDAPLGATIQCSVRFLADDTVIGVQRIRIQIVDATPPVVACREGVNPAGRTPAAKNEDGFFQLVARDNLDPNVRIFVTDGNGSGPFGPFASGDQVKITEAPGGPAGVKPGSGAVTARIKLTTDAVVIAIDASGNRAATRCLVPPPPK